jgi:hypothetical protein
VIEAVFTLDPKLFGTDQAMRNDIDSLLSGLVRLGVPEAHALEKRCSSEWLIDRSL